MTFKLVKVRNVSANHEHGQARVIAKGRTVQVQGPTQAQQNDGTFQIERFPAHLKVHKGDEIAIDTTSNTAEYCSDGTPGQLTFTPSLGMSNSFHSANGVDTCLMLVQAVVKPN
jgi:hypothetical protein